MCCYDLLLHMVSLLQLSLLADAVKEMEKFEGELAVKRANLQALRLNVSDPSTLSQLKGL